MIASRRWPKPIGPSEKKPSPSGPRWAIASVIARRTTGETGSSRRLRMPVTPHMGLGLPGYHGYARGLHLFALDLESGVIAPFANLVGRLTVRVGWCVPVVVD